MRLNKKMIGKQISVIAHGSTGFKRISGKLVGYRSGIIEISDDNSYGLAQEFERKYWRVENVIGITEAA